MKRLCKTYDSQGELLGPMSGVYKYVAINNHPNQGGTRALKAE